MSYISNSCRKLVETLEVTNSDIHRGLKASRPAQKRSFKSLPTCPFPKLGGPWNSRPSIRKTLEFANYEIEHDVFFSEIYDVECVDYDIEFARGGDDAG
jgi:hypothetical protein